jgi:hypothetical protein
MPGGGGVGSGVGVGGSGDGVGAGVGSGATASGKVGVMAIARGTAVGFIVGVAAGVAQAANRAIIKMNPKTRDQRLPLFIFAGSDGRDGQQVDGK